MSLQELLLLQESLKKHLNHFSANPVDYIQELCERFDEVSHKIKNQNPHLAEADLQVGLAFVALGHSQFSSLSEAEILQDWGLFKEICSKYQGEVLPESTEGVPGKLEMASAFGDWGWGKPEVPEVKWPFARVLLANFILYHVFLFALRDIRLKLGYRNDFLNKFLELAKHPNSAVRCKLVDQASKLLDDNFYINDHFRFVGERKINKSIKFIDHRWNPKKASLINYFYFLLIGKYKPRIFRNDFYDFCKDEFGLNRGWLFLSENKFVKDFFVSKETHEEFDVYKCSQCQTFFHLALSCPHCKSPKPRNPTKVWRTKNSSFLPNLENQAKAGKLAEGLKGQALKAVEPIFTELIATGLKTQEEIKQIEYALIFDPNGALSRSFLEFLESNEGKEIIKKINRQKGIDKRGTSK